MGELFKKTWKRETAWILLLWLHGIITFVVFNDVDQGVKLVEACIIPISGFASVVFLGQVYQNVVSTQTPPPPPYEEPRI